MSNASGSIWIMAEFGMISSILRDHIYQYQSNRVILIDFLRLIVNWNEKKKDPANASSRPTFFALSMFI